MGGAIELESITTVPGFRASATPAPNTRRGWVARAWRGLWVSWRPQGWGDTLFWLAVLFLVARQFQGLHPAWGFVLAFAEAGMVGGMADWFAVTALFRRPLGLPIPHTAVIARNQARIGRNLATFVRDKFLDVPSLVALIRRHDPAVEGHRRRRRLLARPRLRQSDRSGAS